MAANLVGCGGSDNGDGPNSGSAEGEEGSGGIYALSGTLSGLQGASLVLTQANGDTLTLDADGAFEFSMRLSDGESYAVAVDAQPLDPDQTCAVELGDGVIDGTSVSDVVVDCVTPIRHVVILGIDGLGGAFVEEADMPNLDALMSEGTWTLTMQNALPTSSSTNWMSMIGGTSPDQHGVLNNGWQPGDSNPPPTLFAVVRGQRPAPEHLGEAAKRAETHHRRGGACACIRCGRDRGPAALARRRNLDGLVHARVQISVELRREREQFGAVRGHV